MALVTSEEMLSKADKNGYAVGAFNVENMEMVMAVINAYPFLSALLNISSDVTKAIFTLPSETVRFLHI